MLQNDTDESAVMTKADKRARPGRFFNDLQALDADIKRGWDAGTAEPPELPDAERTRVIKGRFLAFLLNGIKGYVAGYGNFIGKRTLALHDGLADRIDQLEQRLAAIEAAPLHYEGPHEAGKTYSRGTFVSHGGSLWHANYKTASKPGDGPAWTLAVKSGRDGRDFR